MPRTFSPTPLAPMGPNRRTGIGLGASVNAGLQFVIDTPGLDEAIERLQKFAAIGAADTVRARAGMKFTVSIVKITAMSSTVPYRTGKLKSGIVSSIERIGYGNMEGRVGVKSDQLTNLKALVLEGGRKGNDSATFHSNRREDMFTKRPGGRKFRKIIGYGKVGAIIPRRWLWHAFSRNKLLIENAWKKVLDEITKDLAGK
jgi:hypothetical protein